MCFFLEEVLLFSGRWVLCGLVYYQNNSLILILILRLKDDKEGEVSHPHAHVTRVSNEY